MSKKIDKIKNEYFASCPTGLEELLAAEIKALAYKKLEVVKGGVHFISEPEVALELMLSSRITSRLYKKAYQFEIKTEDDLYTIGKEIKWNAIFDLEQTFKITVVQGMSKNGEKRSHFKSSMFLGQSLKDAIVDRFRDDSNGERPNVDKDQADINILLRVEPNDSEHSTREIAMVLIDMCGAPLSHRGYRDTSFSAPLKENLAAGLVMLSGYTGQETFVDPMCGSGTIIIESLLIKGNIPPSYLALHSILEENETAYWDFMKHLWFTKDEELQQKWKELLDVYTEKARLGFEKLEESKFKTYAYDNEQYAINATTFNLKASDLMEFVQLETADATSVTTGETEGVVITNPPYGERIGQEDDLPKLYHGVGENLKNNFKGFRAYIFTGNMPLLKKISLRTSKKIILWNGSIESRLAEYLLY